jgi:valyl-tRNA synthetase
VELVKTRAYGESDAGAADSARATLAIALSVQLRLFAPFLPFVTEEVWRWWQPGSVHRSPWPRVDELGDQAGGDPSVLTVAAEVVGSIRRAKTTEKRSMRAKVRELTVTGPALVLAAVEAARGDLIDAGGVEELRLVEAEVFSVSVALAKEV